MASLAQVQPQLDPLAELQRRYCIAILGGELRIVDRQQVAAAISGQRSDPIDFYKGHDGRVLLARFLEALPATSKPKQVVEEFLVSPWTHVYDAVAFSPLPQKPSVLNYWSPSPVAPVQGDCSVVMTFLRVVVCDGNAELFSYLVCYLAHMLQKPEEKPGIMLVFLGGQGSGKGTFFQLLWRLWPRTTLQVSDVAHVVGGFNAALERNYAVCMDEALFSGDKKAMDRLKSLITERTISIEEKHQPRRSIESFHRFFAASNHDHFGKVDADDRRFVFFRTSSVRKGDHAYFDRLHAALADDRVIAALAHDLLALDLSGFNVRKRPITGENTAQKVQSLQGFDRYWFEVLHSGDFNTASGDALPKPWEGAVFIPTKTLIAGNHGFQKNVRRYEPMQAQDISTALEKWCPTATRKRTMQHREQAWGYTLPTLAVARRAFEKAIGGQLDWQDDAVEGANE